MTFWRKMIEKLSLGSGYRHLESSESSLVYVLLPVGAQPVDRHSQYEDALEAELQIAGLGCVSGGGSLLSDENPDGSRDIIHCGIDIDAVDVEGVRELLRTHLPELGCPVRTQIHYDSDDGTSSVDEFDGREWILAKPWLGEDPRFG